MLVDAGPAWGRFDQGERRVAPALWDRGLSRLDAVLATHGQPDHVGGLPYVLRAFEVGELWEGPAPRTDHAWRARQARLPVGPVRRALAAGARLEWEGARLTVLAPAPPGRPPSHARNEDSVVVEVVYGEVKLLLTGDAPGETERHLRVARSTVLKLAHHGSAASTGAAFLERTRPRLALVSAGAGNPFGHPRAEVLARCLRAGALVLRTDRDGTIAVSTDGRRVWARTELEAEARRIQ
jgi:competence protein ComEC